MKIGDSVSWESQSGGSWKRKTGEIIAEIPAETSGKSKVPETAKKSHIKFDDRGSKDRVLVAVPAGKNGNITHYYCPLKSVLEAQGN